MLKIPADHQDGRAPGHREEYHRAPFLSQVEPDLRASFVQPAAEESQHGVDGGGLHLVASIVLYQDR